MKFKELIELSKQNAMPDKDAISDSVLKSNKSNKPIIALISILSVISIFAITIVAYMNLPVSKVSQLPDEYKNISPISAVEATETKGDYISLSSGFIITTSKPMSVSELNRSLEISPKTEYSTQKVNGNTFKITPKTALSDNTLYNLKSVYNEKDVYSWAFQTEKEFSIISHSPKNDSFSSVSSVYLEFSHNDVEEFEQYFTIVPSIPGTFEHYGSRWTFIPSIEFEKNTVYTVTISKSISNSSGQALTNDYSFSFISNPDNEYAYMNYATSDLSDTFKSEQIPVATFYSENATLKNANVNVFRLENADQYVSLRKKYTDNRIISSNLSADLANCVRVCNFTADIFNKINDNIHYMKYPKTFETGFYISEITVDTTIFYHVYQVTDLSVYAYAENDNYVLWINDLKTGTPAIAADVSFENNTRLTNKDGIAEFNNCQTENDFAYFKIKYANNHQHVISLNTSAYLNDSKNKNSLFTDKLYYSPSECVKIYGFTDIIGADEQSVSEFSLYCDWNDRYIDLEVDQSGCYSTEIFLNDCFSSNCTVSLIKDHKVVTETSFELIKTNKTNYICSVTTEKDYYFDNDSINYVLTLTDLNGVPASDVDITVDSKTISTDENGKAEYTVTVKEDFTDKPIIEFCKDFIIDNTSVKSHSVYILQSDVFIDASINDNDILDISLNAFEPERFTNAVTSDNPNQFSQAFTALNGDVKICIYKKIFKRDTDNPLYDPLNDKTFYNYISTMELVAENNYITTDGKLSIPLIDLPVNDIQTDYCIEITSSGINEETAKTTIYRGNGLPNDTHYSLSTMPHLQLTDCKTDSPVTTGSVLTVNSESNAILAQKSDLPTIQLQENASQNICGSAYFDGSDMHTLTIDNKQNIIDDLFTVTSDKNIYTGGETVNLTLSSISNAKISALNICVSDTPESTSYRLNESCETTSTYTTFIDTDVSDTIDNSIIKPSQTLYTEIINFNSNASVSFTLPENQNNCYIVIKGIYNNRLINQKFKLNVVTDNKIAYTINENAESTYTHYDYEITEKTKLEADSYAVNADIHLYSDDMTMYFSALEKLHSTDNTDYLSFLGKSVAESLLKNNPYGSIDSKDAEILFNYDMTEQITSDDIIQICSIAYKYADKEFVKNYFYEIINTNPINTVSISSYYILSKLGEPVLDSIKNISTSSALTDDKDIIYLALAFASCGDYTTSNKLFNELIAPKLKLSNDMAFYSGESSESTNVLTLLTSSLASKVSPANAKTLIKYILNNNELLSISTPQLLDYVENYTPTSFKESTVNIYYDSSSHDEINLYNNKSHHLTLTKDECKSVFFEAIKGECRVFVLAKTN